MYKRVFEKSTGISLNLLKDIAFRLRFAIIVHVFEPAKTDETVPSADFASGSCRSKRSRSVADGHDMVSPLRASETYRELHDVVQHEQGDGE